MIMSNFISYANATELMTAIGQKFATLEGAFVFRGSVIFENLPSTLTKAMNGFVYNIEDSFTTDARFVEGIGNVYAAGTNVAVADASGYVLVVPEGNENPSSEGWYEYRNGEYILTDDETVSGHKDYYEYAESYKFDVLGNFVDIDAINDELADTANMVCDDEFDSTQAYAIGDVVKYYGSLYKFKAAHTANTAWNLSEVDKVDVIDLISAAEPASLTTAQINALLALLA